MSHVKNAEAFTRVVSLCTGFGGMYNPGRPTLQIDALTSQVNQVQLALDAVKTAKANYDLHVNKRKQAFDLMPRILAGILRRLEAAGTQREQLEDARTYVQQFNGATRRNRKPVASEAIESAPKQKGSAQQLAYPARVAAFSKLVAALKTEPLYQPFETGYKIPELEATILELMQLNQSVDEARKEWRMKLIDRNKLMYSQANSMLEISRAVKRYVRGLFGLDSGEFALLKEQIINQPGGR